MPTAPSNDDNQVSPLLLRLDNITSYIRGNSNYYKPFPDAAWFTPARMAVIHEKIRRAVQFAVAKIGRVDTDTRIEVERYYLSFLSKYQYTAWGGDIGVDYHERPKKDVSKSLSLQDWHKMLDYLSDRMFYWAKQHRIGLSQVESLMRVWLLVRCYHKNSDKSRSLQHANNMRITRSLGQGRKPGARSRNRRSSRSQGRDSAV